MELYRPNQECINTTFASTSTSTAQSSLGPDGFFYRASTSQAQEPETPNFAQGVEGERGVSHSQTRGTSFAHTLPEVTSPVVPPTSTTSYMSKKATNEIYQS